MNPFWNRSIAVLFLFSNPLTHAQQPNATPKESIIEAPQRDTMIPRSPGKHSIKGTERGYDITVFDEDQTIEAFSFDNNGPNHIIPYKGEIGGGPGRSFWFNFESRARQNIYLTITDAPTAFLSQLMESYFYLFPRKNLPAISFDASISSSPRLKVTLPTGETVEFNALTHEIVDGVFEELAPIDLSPDRFKRKFAQVRYKGAGVMLRVDKRGGDPRFGTSASITLGNAICRVPSALLFNQDQQSNAEFLFPTDQEFNDFLKKKCKFGFL